MTNEQVLANKLPREATDLGARIQNLLVKMKRGAIPLIAVAAIATPIVITGCSGVYENTLGDTKIKVRINAQRGMQDYTIETFAPMLHITYFDQGNDGVLDTVSGYGKLSFNLSRVQAQTNTPEIWAEYVKKFNDYRKMHNAAILDAAR